MPELRFISNGDIRRKENGGASKVVVTKCPTVSTNIVTYKRTRVVKLLFIRHVLPIDTCLVILHNEFMARPKLHPHLRSISFSTKQYKYVKTYAQLYYDGNFSQAVRKLINDAIERKEVIWEHGSR